MISKTLRQGPKTFTQLLMVTRLPRKTLSIRLKELVDSGTVVKDGGYRLTSSSHSLSKGLNLMTSRFLNENLAGKSNAITLTTLLILLIVPFLVTPFALSQQNTFVVKVKVTNAIDLYAWQVRVNFDPKSSSAVNVVPGDFFGFDALVVDATFSSVPPSNDELQSFHGNYLFVFNTRISYGGILLGGTRIGKVAGLSGDGVLATITFARAGPDVGVSNPYIESSVLLDPLVANAAGSIALER